MPTPPALLILGLAASLAAAPTPPAGTLAELPAMLAATAAIAPVDSLDELHYRSFSEQNPDTNPLRSWTSGKDAAFAGPINSMTLLERRDRCDTLLVVSTTVAPETLERRWSERGASFVTGTDGRRRWTLSLPAADHLHAADDWLAHFHGRYVVLEATPERCRRRLDDATADATTSSVAPILDAMLASHARNAADGTILAWTIDLANPPAGQAPDTGNPAANAQLFQLDAAGRTRLIVNWLWTDCSRARLASFVLQAASADRLDWKVEVVPSDALCELRATGAWQIPPAP
ncbi:hypothetical protein ERT44_08090 [Stenotrophomonas sp. MA5]|uniref:hypothetical protein n=1 Tax=Stenotrophomonas sp. MA5 TaxID=2508572 RepID=UPI001009AA7E|nr:hypothetical protein [Stenotrophomonas sp. MA5]RXK67637.1 hypothetical protein ERT44_08090 [Stenotrophomonas sp. MA5]